MGIRTHFDGGKVFNRVQSGSFESHCYATGLKFQEGSHWITHTYQNFTGHSPPQALMDVTNKIESQSKRESKRKKYTRVQIQEKES